MAAPPQATHRDAKVGARVLAEQAVAAVGLVTGYDVVAWGTQAKAGISWPGPGSDS